jgi:hypothetical protein
MDEKSKKKYWIIGIVLFIVIIGFIFLIFIIVIIKNNNSDDPVATSQLPPSKDTKPAPAPPGTDANGIMYGVNGCLKYYVATDKSFINTNVPRAIYTIDTLENCSTLCTNNLCGYALYDSNAKQCQIYNFQPANDHNVTLLLKDQPKNSCKSSITTSSTVFDNNEVNPTTNQIVQPLYLTSQTDANTNCQSSCLTNNCDGYYIYLDDYGNYQCRLKFMTNSPGTSTLISADN